MEAVAGGARPRKAGWDTPAAGLSKKEGLNKLKFSGADRSLEPQSAFSSGLWETEQIWQPLSARPWVKASWAGNDRTVSSAANSENNLAFSRNLIIAILQ